MFSLLKGVWNFLSSERPPTQRPAIQERPRVDQDVQPRSSSTRRSTISILVLGRSGAGKTLFINTARLGGEETEDSTPNTRTARAISHSVNLPNQKFKLIDTPGFDNTVTTNVEAFSQISDYLLDQKRSGAGVSGVVYVHRAGDPLESRALAQNIKVLTDIYLGEAGLSRLTVLVVSANSRPLDCASTAQMITRPNSALRPLCSSKNTRILVSNFDRADIESVLMSYAFKDPILLRIQQNPPENTQNLVPSIEACLGYCETGSVRAQLEKQAKQYRTHYEKEIGVLQASQQKTQSEVFQYSSALRQTEQQVKSHRDEITGLRRQLQQTQTEYASLRSQLQLQENVEQSQIVQGLKDLNRDIDDIGRSISEYLIDSYGQITFEKDPIDITALDSSNLDELKRLIGHTEGSSSLISSSTGVGMMAEDFFDYSIRSLLCLHLCQYVFDPFHPGVDPSQSTFVKAMYADVQQREPQAVAAKWRVDSFKSIYKPDSPNRTSQYVSGIVQEFLQSRLGHLITNFFGPKTEVTMDAQHFERLQRLVQTAWDWNATLKGEVVMLGDFHLTAYPPASVFDHTLMTEFEPNPHQPPPTSILGTLGLGLISSRAVGGGQPPEITIVCKALVATESLYAQV